MGGDRLAGDPKKATETEAHLVLIDETGLFLNPLVRRTLALIGRTPILDADGGHREKVSVIGGVSVFLSNRYRRREIVPRRRITDLRKEEMRQALEPFIEVVAGLGRVPYQDEFPGAAALVERFGSLKRAFAAVQRLTGPEAWDDIARRRREDILVYLALSRFRKRPPISLLPLTLQRDLKAFFGAYTKACNEADSLLFKAGDPAAIDEACKRATVGKLLPDDLYVHHSAVDSLEPLLRIYEGCGRAYLGEVEGANLIKIHRRTGKLSYLVYPEFEANPHPALMRCVKLNLRARQIECYDYVHSTNPPVLHRKETFLPADHELREKFARLTLQEEKHGLLDEPAGIGTMEGWKRRLAERGFSLKGHRLLRLETAAEGQPALSSRDLWPARR